MNKHTEVILGYIRAAKTKSLHQWGQVRNNPFSKKTYCKDVKFTNEALTEI